MAHVLTRQFDICANPSPRRSKEFPFLVVLQSDWIADTSSVVVAPLVEAEGERPPRLYPTVEVSGRRLILVVSDLAALPRAALSTPVASLASERDRIIAALDLLFTGY